MAKRLITGGLALAGLCLSALGAPAATRYSHATPHAPPRAARPAPPPAAASAALVAQLAAVIQEGIAAAHAAQKDELTIGSLSRGLADADAQLAAKQQALGDARAHAAALLAAIERYVHTPRVAALVAPQSPIDRLRSGMLMAAAVPALSARAHALIAEMQNLSTFRSQALSKQDNLSRDRQDLAANRQRVDQLDAKREDLRKQILGPYADSDQRALKQGTVAVDLPDLIQRCDGEAQIRDRERLARAALAKGQGAVDPTKPQALRTFDKNAVLTSPIAGPVAQRFGQTNESGMPAQGATLAGLGDGIVVAPFDGEVEYAGPFRGYGSILIIDHGGGYHSMLAGLGRVDAKIGEWVIAGEPVGTLPDAAKTDDSVTLYFEVRQDGRPVDPQLSLADQAGPATDHRVSE